MRMWQVFRLAVLSAGLLASAVASRAESSREIVDAALAGWPDTDREQVQLALGDWEAASNLSTEQIVTFLSDVAQAHGSPPAHTAEGAALVAATIDAARSAHEQTTVENPLYQSQFAEAKTVGEAWMNAHLSWFPEGVAAKSVADFAAAIPSAQANPFNLGFQVSLPEDDHADLMTQWKEVLDELDSLGEVSFRRNFGIMLLNQATTPAREWQQNEVTASGVATGLLNRYLELRQEMAVERLPQYAAVKVARDAVFRARIQAQGHGGPVLRPAGYEAHEDLLDQEVLWFAMAALDGRAPFTPHAAADGNYRLGMPESALEIARQQRLVLKYGDTNQGTSGPGPFEPHELQAIIQTGDGCARFEILTRRPLLSKSAIFMEPIGWTLVRGPKGLGWLPGFMGASKGVYRAKVNDPEGPVIDCGFLDWGLNRKTGWALYNLAFATGGIYVPGKGPSPDEAFEFGWARQAPWLYMSRIEWVKYALRDWDGERVLDTARLIDADTGEVAATITWREPDKTEGGERYYREVVMEIAPIALKGLWRLENGPRDNKPVAPERSIVYRFAEANLDGKSAVVPTYFAVRGPAQSPLAEMTFDTPVAVTETPKELCDPLSVLPIPQDPVDLAFYSCYKEYYYRDKTVSIDVKLKGVNTWLKRFSQARERALAAQDYSLALKCQFQVYGAAIFGRAQYSEWKAEVFRTMEMLEAVPERGVVWDAYASMIQRVYGADDPALATEVEKRFTRMVTERYSAAEAMGLGGDYSFVHALPCFSAVEAKSTDRNLLIPAAIGKVGALAFVAKYVRNQPEPWEVAQCEVYLDAARETLKRAESAFAPGDPESWVGLAESARRSIAEAEQFLQRSS